MNRKRALKIRGAGTDTDIRDLKKRYRELMRMTHPDSVKENDYPYEVHEINEAYMTIDHIVPQSLGGTSNIENLRGLCRACNGRKSSSMKRVSAKISESGHYVSRVGRSQRKG